MAKKIGIGLVGAGVISQLHYDAIMSNRHVELVGVAEKNKPRSKKIARKWKVRACDTISDLVKDKSIDAVFILSPTWMHYD